MIHLAFYFAPLDSPGGPLVWLFGGGIGTNIGASLIWGFLAGFIGYLVAKRVKVAWRHLHRKVDALHDRHDQHTEHLERIGRSLAELHEKVDGQAAVKPVAIITPKRVRKPAARKPKA